MVMVVENAAPRLGGWLPITVALAHAPLFAGTHRSVASEQCLMVGVNRRGKLTRRSPPKRGQNCTPLNNGGPATFAVGRIDVTFAEWDNCVAVGACPKVSDIGQQLGGTYSKGPAPCSSMSVSCSALSRRAVWDSPRLPLG